MRQITYLCGNIKIMAAMEIFDPLVSYGSVDEIKSISKEAQFVALGIIKRPGVV